MSGKVVVQLKLHDGVNTEGSLYRVKKGWHLHFALGASLIGKYVRLFTNYPMTKDTPFDRTSYRELTFTNPTAMGHANDSFDDHAELLATHSGAFEYFFTTDCTTKPDSAAGEGYFIVDPQFSPGSGGRTWELDGVLVHTYLSKNLGHFVDWLDRLQVSKEAGYNMIHFTPLQELGYSRSGYSLKDQLKVNHEFSTPDKQVGWQDIADLVHKLETDWGMLAMTDLVYNHTANDSPWLQEHPDATYNLLNSPHLRPAYLMDRIVCQISLDTSRGKYKDEGLPPKIDSADHLAALRSILEREVIKYRIHEFYLAHVDDTVAAFKDFLVKFPEAGQNVAADARLTLTPSHHYKRLQASVDFDIAARDHFKEHRDVDRACNELRHRLEGFNGAKYAEICAHISQAYTNVLANAEYRFLAEHGPRIGLVTPNSPIMYNYFLQPDECIELDAIEELMDSPKGAWIMAHNGWVMNDDPLRNFAEPGSNVYLRRELIVWGDSVKLRYGSCPEDSPYLWHRMTEYTEMSARIFHAVRLDNCHSTPLHVAQYMLDKARAVRGNLYIVAELFTGSEHVDNIFINKLGINSLIREAQSAWDSHEQGRLVHRFGGLPVGAFMQPSCRPLKPSLAHALFYDLTHDNQSPASKRSVHDFLPTGALVTMACCAAGSTRGYDELVPHYIDVVHEERVYGRWKKEVAHHCGIMAAKAALNHLHADLAKHNFTEVYVDQLDADVVAVTRHCPSTHESVVLVAHTAFKCPGHDPKHRGIRPLTLPGRVKGVMFEAKTVATEEAPSKSKFAQHDHYINGLCTHTSSAKMNLPIEQSTMIAVKHTPGTTTDELNFLDFPPGSVVAIRVVLDKAELAAIDALKHCLATQFSFRVRATSRGQLVMPSLDGEDAPSAKQDKATLQELVSNLTLVELNRIFFRCGPEENADAPGNGPYEIPGYKQFVYCGIQGVMSEFSRIRGNQDLGHPLCGNLRDGDWLPKFLADRLLRYPGTVRAIGQWMEPVLENLSQVPRYLIPSYFDVILTGMYSLMMEQMWHLMGDHVVFGSSMVRVLAIGSVQFCGVVANAELPALSAKLNPPITGERPTLSAGFPHFAEGVFRNWGRDTFIALRGLLLLLERYEDARAILLGYAGVLRHGLIPNLLGCGGGVHARYNCRDAVWWWLAALQAYDRARPQDNILGQTVRRLYPTDDSCGRLEDAVDQPLHDTVFEALQRHVEGILFRERNAGRQLDEQMTHEGFNVKAGIDPDTGFPYGGNAWNCGTWMDKMGSSDKAGNRGRPATPRDGSAVELVGLCATTLAWLTEKHAEGKFPKHGVHLHNGTNWTWKAWLERIREGFEPAFWMSWDDMALRQNRGIYRDSVGSSAGYTDKQFRPNFLVAMVMDPNLFDPDRAWYALDRVENELLGPIGMKTLGPDDWAYRGHYDNSNDSMDPTVASGYNYHQGPEWVWPVGYFLRARLIFAHKLEEFDESKHKGLVDRTVRRTQALLAKHHEAILQSDWRSLPELTNENGSHCRDSCPAQAWSIACLTEALYDLLSVKH